ncbi:DUF2218 domain-containing protein [Kitasatospora purpeofusca]|uniref:DUF2218 domain-containing protein n=1 Tax=Kitasatospora purpeofusca TaxID=67352 RepID=UPI000AD71CFA|nr:DUF2218 domain-containing protein [Kitasatospora purpeofusca]MCX4757800.1 DUF2218 domain-containing protein [Kitasatospora purpeofusca]WSR34504.1 DUF2218 domain-containing protein [Kitasatospora purpeofusca]WSR42713.1 DUF2218 domain-containing protein [Kitasatospora purpeofusca]
MPRSEARVTTDRSARYAKQLAAHMGRKIKADWSEETGHGTLVFGAGTATLEATPDALLLAVEGETENLPGLEDVVGRHLVRFGARDELVVEWRRDNGEAGLVHRNEEEPAEG